ncbi:MAG TPA: proton-conducting transporter membrane subunit [Roseovarius sp.]|uniref:proton-conducting transporter transmembrane domain-containing protein n=1 Tax=Marivita sp. TaxID=2003365 RepID=UPI0025C263C2|nr:proton-conducting transporter membrane subunit [Marivita sp.]HKL45488.1 proton-conducting transporter membrane subunit [Roseovarius sp.]
MIPALPLLAPVFFALVGLVYMRRELPRGSALLRLGEYAGLASIIVSLGALALLIRDGSTTGPLIGAAEMGIAARIDAVSVTMLMLVSFIGWVVMRFAVTYTDGEKTQTRFLGWLSLGLASVLLLVTAGNLIQLILGWGAVGLCVNRLLLTYPERAAAQRAARKKALCSAASDAGLIAGAFALAAAYGTADIATILDAARAGEGGGAAMLAAALLAISALFKSAQIPTHGWLTEVMEAPTPVSALLHAGVVNAGGFLLIRFADVLLLAPGVLSVLVMIGGFSALFGGLVMLTQPSVKTSLAWSTVAQMGFMILQCGLALFPLALLHIVAHSLYKAHAFLASGGAVAQVASIRRPGPVAIPNGRAVLKSFALALAIYAIIGLLLGIDGKSAQAIVLGAVLVMGVAYLLAQGLADAAPEVLTRRMAAYSVATTLSYFALQSIAIALTAGTVPATPSPGPLQWALMALTVLSFGTVAWAQATFPNWATHPAAQGLRVHLSNGFYLNAVFDRLTGGWAARNR